jgi:methyltransferase
MKREKVETDHLKERMRSDELG